MAKETAEAVADEIQEKAGQPAVVSVAVLVVTAA